MTSSDRPLLTFALFAYNQEQFIVEAVKGALSQTYSPLEIILSDDCSSDRTFDIMQEMTATYQGPNQVIVRRNERNLGLIGHINRVMEMVQGELIVAAAGDDISLPNRVERIFQEYLKSNRQAYSIFSNAIWMDETGKKMNFLRKESVNPEDLTFIRYGTRNILGFVTGCTHAWRRECFDYFGPMLDGIGGEDVVIPFRSALLGQISYIPDILVYYRQDRRRTLNPNGNYGYLGYRNKWIDNKIKQLRVFQNRLQDLRVFVSNNIATPSHNVVRDFTVHKMSELRDFVEIVEQPSLWKKCYMIFTKFNLLKLQNFLTQITSTVIPVQIWFGYIKLIMYYRYQDLQKTKDLGG